MTKLEHLKKYDVILMFENTTVQTVVNECKELPTDIHLIKYFDDNNEPKVDAVRSYKMSDIFDGYYDYGIKNISEITSGYGNIKPKLYNPNKDEKK